MANTFISLATITVGSGGAATMQFSSIPSTYDDLVLYVSARNTGNGAGNYLNFNGNTTSNYYARRLITDGASVTSPATPNNTSLFFLANDNRSGSNIFANAWIYIPNYKGTTLKKTVLMDSTDLDNGTSYDYIEIDAGLWDFTTAISSITLTPESAGYAQYSTATLYGIKKS